MLKPLFLLHNDTKCE